VLDRAPLAVVVVVDGDEHGDGGGIEAEGVLGVPDGAGRGPDLVGARPGAHRAGGLLAGLVAVDPDHPELGRGAVRVAAVGGHGRQAALLERADPAVELQAPDQGRRGDRADEHQPPVHGVTRRTGPIKPAAAAGGSRGHNNA